MPHAAWNKRLTPEVESFIVEKYRLGLSAGEILKAIPFKTRKTVYDVLDRYGVSKQWSHRTDVRRIAQYFYRDGGDYLKRKFALLRECL